MKVKDKQDGDATQNVQRFIAMSGSRPSVLLLFASLVEIKEEKRKFIFGYLPRPDH